LGAFDSYISSRRTPATREGYGRNIKLIAGDPDAFLERAKADRRGTEDLLISKVAEMKGRVAPSTIGARLAMLKSFFDYYEVQMNWKRVRSTAPRARLVALDRGPLLEEVRKALDVSQLREKVILLFMLSGGFRVGAFLTMDVGHVVRLPSGVGRVRVYAGEPEEYSTFVSREAMDALDAYLEERRRRAFEKVGPGSPLVRDREYQKSRLRHAATKTIAVDLYRIWVRSGVRTPGQKAEFKLAHGLRKYFKTTFPASACELHGQLDVEVLMGHFLNYHKPTLQHLEEVYLRAEPSLTVSEELRLKKEIEDQGERHQDGLRDVRLELLEEKEKRRELEERLERAWPVLKRLEELEKERAALDST
jgi:site-specific recombinase XerD